MSEYIKRNTDGSVTIINKIIDDDTECYKRITKIETNSVYGLHAMERAILNVQLNKLKTLIDVYTEKCFKMGESFAADGTAEFLKRCKEKSEVQKEILKLIDDLIEGEVWKHA